MSTLLSMPSHLALCLSDGTVVPLLAVDDECPEHGAVSPVFTEIIEAGTTTPTFGGTWCLECAADLDWQVQPVRLGPALVAR